MKRCRHKITSAKPATRAPHLLPWCTDKEYAVKIIDKRDLVKTAKAVKQEIEVLRRLGRHPNVVVRVTSCFVGSSSHSCLVSHQALEDFYEGKDRYYIVMEL